MASLSNNQLHAIVIPLMSQSHLIPMIDLSKILAQQGLIVSIIVTPLNANRYKSTIDRAKHYGLKINLVPLHFPCDEAGLPQGCENLDTLPSPSLKMQFIIASGLLQKPLESYLAKVNPNPSCLISSLPWTNDVANKFNIPRYSYQGISCFTLLCSHNMILHKVLESIQSEYDPILVPNIPDKIELTYAQLPKLMQKNLIDDGIDNNKDILHQMKLTETSSQGLLVNTFEELEFEYVKSYKDGVKNIFCIGPLSLCNKEENDMFERGNKTTIDEQYFLRWLDSKKPRSVIYVCFGSLCNLLPKQLIELGMGLEASKFPFIWIIREGDYKEEIRKWIINENFEERVKGRGLLIKGWAPQVLILSHIAIGGFLTHCGWNSTLEGICAGLPMITWPMFAEQFFNEKLIVQVLKIGVRIGVDVSMEWQNGVYVRSDDVQNAIEQLMNEGDEGIERRKRAQELGEKARKAIEEGGSSYSNVLSFIQQIKQDLNQKNK